MAEMEDATNTMEHCYSSRFAGKGQYQTLPLQTYTPESSIASEHGVIFPLRELPHHNVEQFIGRTDILSTMSRWLKPDGSCSTQHMTIWGLGGVGKSQTALAYANKYGANFDAIFWVRAESETSLNQSFSTIAITLGLTSHYSGSSPSENRDSVLYWLRTCSE